MIRPYPTNSSRIRIRILLIFEQIELLRVQVFTDEKRIE